MFQNPKLTNAGKALFYENMSGEQIVFTTIKLGSGELTQPIAAMTDLINTEVVVAASTTAEADYVEISGTFANTELAEGFYWREVGVFAANPAAPDDRSQDILYCYQNAYDTADYIPTASVETIEKHICVPVIVGDAANVVCNLQGSLINASLQDITNHNTSSQAHQDIRRLLEKCPQLDSAGKIPDDVLPDMDFIPKTDRGKAGGVASLSAAGKIPLDQLVIDANLSGTSLNPVQNKVVQQAIAGINQALAGKAPAGNYAGSSSPGGPANNAIKLQTPRSVHVNLGSTAAVNFDGSGNISPGVQGILGVTSGGTGANNAAAARNNLGINLANLGGCRIVTGQYTGNGVSREAKLGDFGSSRNVPSYHTSNPIPANTNFNVSQGQFINLGFKPKLLIVSHISAADNVVTATEYSGRYAVSSYSSSERVYTDSETFYTAYYCIVTQLIDVVSNGFYVGNTSGSYKLNATNNQYHYIAFI